MTLFATTSEPIGKRPAFHAESTYTYLRDSQRAPIIAIRELLESWFAELPEPAKLDLQKRFRSPTNKYHNPALFEIYLHHFLISAGFTISLHPSMQGNANHPDFLVCRDDVPMFYLEATVVGYEPTKDAETSRMNVVYDAVNQLSLPDFFLSIHIAGAPETPPSTKKLRRDLKLWLDNIRWEDVARAFRNGDYDRLPTYTWQHDGWTIEFRPIPKSSENRGSITRAIGHTAPEEAQWISLDDLVKGAVIKKNRYGKVDLPLVIAIQVDDEFPVDDYDVMNGLLGREELVVHRDGTHHNRRAPNGAWSSPNGPQNTTVSAVLVWKKMNAWSFKVAEPIMVHNPWAAKPLAPDVLPISQYVADWEKNIHEVRLGASFSSLLKLPEPWPPLDDCEPA